MGTTAHVEFWLDTINDSNSHVKPADKLIRQVEHEMQRIDHLMSPYKADSELSLVNQKAANTQVHISNELFDRVFGNIHHRRWMRR